MTNYDVVTKLIGRISPVGETNQDKERFDNLKELCELVEKLIIDIDSVSGNKDRHEYSMKNAGKYADDFLTKKLGIRNY